MIINAENLSHPVVLHKISVEDVIDRVMGVTDLESTVPSGMRND